MTLLTQYSQINPDAWDELLKKSPVTSWFQTPEAYCFFDSLSFMEAFVVAVKEGDRLLGLTVGYVQGDGGRLKQMLSRRAIIVGGPLLADDISNEALTLMLNTIKKQLSHRCIYIETRNLNVYSRWRSSFEKCGFEYVPHYNFHIDVSEGELIDKRMDKSRRRRIRRATENGVTINSENPDIKGFYDILSNLYRTKIHKPLPPFSMFEQLGNMPFSKYFIVKDTLGNTIGGQLILMLEHRVAYAWYCCGLDKEYHDLYPSIMANYAAIRYAADNGFERYDMMGAGTPKEDYGVRDFKAQFGGTLVEHGRYLHVCRPLIYWMGSKAIALLKYLHK